MASLHQGDILKVEKIKHPVLVVSKDFFNTSGEIIGCPIIKNSTAVHFIYGCLQKKMKAIYSVKNWRC